MKLTNEKGIALIYYVIIVFSIVLIIFSGIIIYNPELVKNLISSNKKIANNDVISTADTNNTDTSGNNDEEKPFVLDESDFIEFSFTDASNDERTLIQEGNHYDIYDFGGTTSVTINGIPTSLNDAVNNGKITRADIISQLTYDANEGKCYSDMYMDGGSMFYSYDNFNVTVTASMSYTKQKIFFSRKDLGINSFEELYPDPGPEIIYDENTGLAILSNSDGYDKNAPKSSDNMTFSFTPKRAKKLESIINDKKYNICTFGGNLTVNIDGNGKYLQDVINNTMSTLQLLHKLENDANLGCCSSNYYSNNGKQIVYYYDNITVIVSNKLLIENPEIVFAPSYDDDSDIVSSYILSKIAPYTGSDYNEGFGINCKLEDKINDKLWSVSIVKMSDEEIEQELNKYIKAYSVYGDVDDEDIKYQKENLVERSVSYYLLDLSSASSVENNVSIGDTIALVYSGKAKNGYSLIEFGKNSKDPSAKVTFTKITSSELENYNSNKSKFIVDKVLNPNKCYLIKEIYSSGPSMDTNILFINSDDVIENNALDEGSTFIVENSGSLTSGIRDYDYLDGVISIEKAK